jgi:hypothetical protein
MKIINVNVGNNPNTILTYFLINKKLLVNLSIGNNSNLKNLFKADKNIVVCGRWNVRLKK